MWEETNLDISTGCRAVFYIHTHNWTGEASGVISYNENKGRNVVVLDCGGIYDIWHAPFHLPFNRIPATLAKTAKLASETLWFKAGNIEHNLY